MNEPRGRRSLASGLALLMLSDALLLAYRHVASPDSGTDDAMTSVTPKTPIEVETSTSLPSPSSTRQPLATRTPVPPTITPTQDLDRVMDGDTAAKEFWQYLPPHRNARIEGLWLTRGVIPRPWQRWCSGPELPEPVRPTYVALIDLGPVAAHLDLSFLPDGHQLYFTEGSMDFALAIDAASAEPLSRGSLSTIEREEPCSEWLDTRGERVEFVSRAGAQGGDHLPNPSLSPTPSTPLTAHDLPPSVASRLDDLDLLETPSHLQPALDYYPLVPGTTWTYRESCDDDQSSQSQIITTTIAAARLSTAGTLVVERRHEYAPLQRSFEPEPSVCPDMRTH